jgi:diacylglycerol kinase family enzyme
VVLLFAGIWLVAHNIIFAIVVVATAALLSYTTWLVVTGSGKRRTKARLFVVITSVALIAEFVYFIRQVEHIWALVIFIILTVIYVELAETLRAYYWRQQRAAAQDTQQTANFKKPYLIMNPKSGNGRAIKAHIDVLAKEQGIKVLILKKEDNVEEIARRAAKAGADVLGISGGDGSIGAVAKVALEHKLPMVVLPGGTKCHFARDIGLDPKRITDSLAGFTGVRRQVDLGSINGRIFLNNVSFGLYADIVDNPDYRNNKLHVIRQVLQEIVSGRKNIYDLQFLAGKKQIKKAVQVLVSVNAYKTLSIFELGQRERLDEGILQVTAVTKLNDEMITRLMRSISIDRLHKHEAIPDFYQWTAKTFNITSKTKKLVVGVDGEREEYQTPVTVQILPGALTIYVPAEGIRSRPKGAFSPRFAKQLWRAITN